MTEQRRNDSRWKIAMDGGNRYDPYREIDSYLERAHIDIDSALDGKCIDDDDGTATDLIDAYSENKYSDSNVGDRQPNVVFRTTTTDVEDVVKNGHCFCEIDDDFDFISTEEIDVQALPLQSWTNFTSTSDSSPTSSMCTVSDREMFDVAYDRDRSFSDRTIIRNRWQKSSSTSVLKKITKVNEQTRSQSDRHLSEIETAEACKWLRAAGFPQYAQMYEDVQFPIDLNAVKDDHPLLDSSVLHSLYRRLRILNKCAQFHQHRSPRTDDSEDEQCALSENWAYQSDIRRWSRTCQSDEMPVFGEDGKASRRSSHPYRADELQKPPSPRNKFHRALSPSCRKRRDEIVSTNGGSVLDSLSKHLGDFNASNSEIYDPVSPFRRSRRRKTGSLDKTDSWLHLPNSSDSILFPNIDKGDENEIAITSPTKFEENGREIYTLSANQLRALRKLALLKLTAHMEKYCSTHKTGWNWNVTKFMRKLKCPAYKDKVIFGVSITVIQQRTGLPLPKSIAEALHWLVENAADNVGIFRKPGVRSRIQHLKTIMEEIGDDINFNDQQAYDVADTVKQYFRELPEALLTYKLSETFVSIFQHIPPHLRREAVLCGLLLMPDEHREALQVLLYSLRRIAQYSTVNQMTESNLALCFAPTLFHHHGQVGGNKPATGMPSAKELDENKAGHDCLLFLIKNYDNLFNIPEDLLIQCNSSEMKVVLWSELSLEDNGDWKAYLGKCQTALLNEVKEKARGWIVVPSHYDKIEISYKKVADNHPLRLWKIYLEIEASPIDIFNRITKERGAWDEELESNRVVSEIDGTTDIYQYVRRNLEPLPLEDYCVIRSWRTNLPKGGCILVETSVEHNETDTVPNGVRRVVLASRYLVESSGSHSSKLIHMARVDKRGKMPEWYHKNYGHLLALNLHNLQNSFRKTHAARKCDI